jgi:hypothetical protein
MKFIIAAASVAAAITAPALGKTTVAVGACNPGVPTYNSIQQAVDSVPPNSTIEVCPGTYAEQVTIAKSLTLTGFATAASTLSAIVAPAGGLAVNGADLDGGSPVAAQILVTGGSNVIISGLTIDGSNNNVTSCGIDVVGILYQNASGTIKADNVINQTQPAGYTGCQGGLAIYAESGGGGAATVTISGNQVQGYQKNGITADDTGTHATISANAIIGAGPTTGAAENAIQIAFGATGVVDGNQLGDTIWALDQPGDTGDAATGILVYDSAGVTIRSNTVGSTQFGIAVVSDGQWPADGAAITGNQIAATYLFDAVDVCGAGNAQISKNTINGATESAIHLDSTCATPSTGNTVSGNRVNGACAAVLQGAGSGGTISGLTALNAANVVLAGDVCPATTGDTVRQGHKSVSVFRPRHVR